MTYDVRALGEVGTVVMGLSPAGEFVGADPSVGLPLLNGPTEFGPTSPSPRQWTSEWSRAAERGDTLFCVRGSTTGRMNVAQRPYAIGRGLAAIRGATSADTAFLRYALIDGLPKLLSRTAGSVFPNLSVADIKALEVPFPPEETRRSIAATLGSLDAKIESNRRVIGVANGLLDAVAEREAESAPTVALGLVTSITRRTANPAALGNATVDHFSLPAFDAGATPEAVPAAAIMSNKTMLRGRSILVSRLNPRTNRTWWVTPRDRVIALASTEFASLTATDDVELAALWLAVRSPFFRGELTRRVTGTSGSHQRVRPDDMLTIDVPDPRAMAGGVKLAALALLETVRQLRAQSANLGDLRDALLPELLSGRMLASPSMSTFEMEHA